MRLALGTGIKLLASTVVCVSVAGCPMTGSTTPDTVPDFAAASFSNPTKIDHPYRSLEVGRTRTYTAQTPDGVETVVIQVLDETREILGVTCRVVRDRVSLDGVIIEDTYDWFAQDDDGNIWYMGEDVTDYNYDDDGNFINTTQPGAWEAGKDIKNLGANALPGYLITATPAVGDAYHQEYYAGEAEDEVEVVAVNVAVTLTNGATYTCIQTRDFTALDPGTDEFKFYAPNVGLVLAMPVDGSKRVELVSGP